jgi:3-oxoacyl-[acyl-carrier protein] reductase
MIKTEAIFFIIIKVNVENISSYLNNIIHVLYISKLRSKMNIVITGVSRGIGYQIAMDLSKNKEHKIFGLSRDEEKLKELSEAVGSGSNFIGIACDITNEKSVEEAVRLIEKNVSGIEVLINNAGLLINKPFEELTQSDWKEIYNVNVFGVVNLTRQLIPLLKKGTISMQKNTKSHVVNISSMGGIQGSKKFKGLSAYSSSKGALITLSECLSEELGTSGVHVNCIALGSVETEMFREAFPKGKAAILPEDISKWIEEFAMTGHSFFNGKVIPVSSSVP